MASSIVLIPIAGRATNCGGPDTKGHGEVSGPSNERFREVDDHRSGDADRVRYGYGLRWWALEH